MTACVECTKLDASEELRMSRLVIEGGCGEQGNKALTSNKLSTHKPKYFSLVRHISMPSCTFFS